MNYITSQYFGLNRMLLLTVGLWPYQQSKLCRLQFIFFLSILTTAVIFQFTTFINSKCTTDFIVKILSNALFFSVFLIKYIFFAINTETVKDLLTQLQNVYQRLKDEHENAIVKQYSYHANCYTIVLTTFSICGLSAFIGVQYWSNIINIILPINVSRPRRLPIMTEYFVDQEKYFFLILLHLNIAVFTGVIIMVAVGTMLIAYLTHTCGLFKISSYRIKHAMRANMLQNINSKNNEKLIKIILEEIIRAVDIHRQAMRFEAMLFCLIVTGVISLSLHLFQIFRIARTENNLDEILFPFLFAFASILYMFYANYTGQNVTDHNNHVFVTVYNVEWYLASLCIQRIMLFLLQRNVRDFTLGVSGLFIGSLDCFATLVKTSVSYFTVIYSMEYLDTPEEMICVESRYFTINRILLLTTGLWPYAQSKLVRVQLILLYGILTSFIVFQFTIFVTTKCTLQYTIEILSVTTLLLFLTIQYSMFCFNMDVVKYLLELLQCTYNELRDESEVAIIEQYWNFGRRCTEILTLIAMSSMCLFIFTPFLPYIFVTVFMPGNESRPHISLQIVTEYFINQERYFYLIMLHTNAAFCVGMTALVATGTMCITYVQHICGMLRIASYRMERIMRIDTYQINRARTVNLIFMGIVYAVDMHHKAIKFIKIFISSINKFLFLLIINGLLTASLNLYQVFQELSSEHAITKIIRHCIFLLVYYLYTFLANYYAQQIIDHNNHIFVTVYNVQWYIAPLRIQKMILFLLQRGTKAFDNFVIIGGLFTGSLQGFATLVSASISYFTFLYSTRQHTDFDD
ncbi:uncharacterized protein [Anoplolepis gracilipes]|uniref:uncharacterized protein n=1 Tax=Anoplolepis gracilipes TaxID=354296 RepID=UPI003B9E1506